ncbi:hypothetical protein AA313_de0206539 [Arthrobotrys entomopaga]|nr:hypothetical protein AA313_de0206539 [Arthrobotrys entomopaga]
MNSNGHFENQLAGVLPSHIHGLQASRSLPTISRRSLASHQALTQSSQESDHLSLLATSAAVVASLPGPSEEYTNSDLTNNEVDLPTCAPSSYGLSSLSHWNNHAVEEVLRTVAELPHLRPTATEPNARETTKSYVPPGITTDQSLYFEGTFAPPVATTSPGVSTYLQTSNVRDGSFSDAFNYSHLASGLSHMGIKVSKPRPGPPPSPSTLQNPIDKGDADAQGHVVYAGSLPSNYPLIPYNFVRYPHHSNPIDVYSVRPNAVSARKFSDSSTPSPTTLTPLGEDKDTRALSLPGKNRISSTSSSSSCSSSSSSLSPTSAMGAHGSKASMKHTQTSTPPQNIMRDSIQREVSRRPSSTTVSIERTEFQHGGPMISISRTTAQPMRAITAPRPSSAGCGSAVASPKLSYDPLPYNYSQHRHPTVGH